jgi:hypothetical protein
MKKLITVILMLSTIQSFAGSPACTGPGEIKVSWPTANPIWELCYLGPENSSAADGSSLEIRDAYYNGFYALERAHIPMLFANYTTSTCYRDWKDTPSNFLEADRIENPSRAAITTCDISTKEDQVVGNCPFRDLSTADPSDFVGKSEDCGSAVQVEKYSDRMVITSNHSAAWYKYSSRYTFYIDGRIVPRFGFGNSNGTNASITHWHHAYYRINFDIDGADNDIVYSNDSIRNTEFTSLRNERMNTNWKVEDTQTGRGYRIEASPEDYLVDINVSPNNPSGYHNTDVMVTKYKVVPGLGIPEYSDTPGNNSLGNCSMLDGQLVNGESLIDEDVVFWYRTAVTDLANAGLVCKFGGPIFYPTGDWKFAEYYNVFVDGFE